MINKISIPDDVINQFTTVAQSIGTIERTLGKIMDEWISELPKGLHETAFELFADLYRTATGQTRSPRTMRAWRTAAIMYSKHDIEKYHTLTDSQLTAAVVLAEIRQDKTTPQQIAAWAVEHHVSSVPKMYDHWGEQTSTNGETDPGWISSIKRYVRHWPQNDPRHAELSALLAQVRALIEGR